MKSIKIRAWDIQNKRMITALDTSAGIVAVKPLTHMSGDDFYIPMLSTGLRDVEGAEIYEGDWVVFFNRYDDPVSFPRGYAKFDQSWMLVTSSGKLLLRGLFDKYGAPEILGNIYEHPEYSEAKT